METQLFKWQSWDTVDEGCYMFYDVETISEFGGFPVGTKFDHATVDYQHGVMQLIDLNGAFHDFNLGLVVKERVTHEATV